MPAFEVARDSPIVPGLFFQRGESRHISMGLSREAKGPVSKTLIT